MSSAFTKESDNQDLGDISPTVSALILYLTRENNGIRVYEIRNYMDAEEHTIHEMNNGFSYTVKDGRKWVVIED